MHPFNKLFITRLLFPLLTATNYTPYNGILVVHTAVSFDRILENLHLGKNDHNRKNTPQSQQQDLMPIKNLRSGMYLSNQHVQGIQQ